MLHVSWNETLVNSMNLSALKWGVIATLALGVLAYAGVLAWMYTQQEALLFRPTQLPPDHRFDLPGVSEVKVPVEGGHLSAMHFQQANPKGVVFFLHGNAGDLSIWLTSTAFYSRVGFDLFMIDYRGYGKSPGRIESEAQLHADVRAAWDWVAPQYASHKRVIYGRSLGSALAAQLAARVPSDLLVLVTPYSSVLQVTAETYPWVPSALLRYPLRTDLGVAQVKAPVLILHGDQDEVFSMSHAEHLQGLNPGAELVKVPGARHGDIHTFSVYTQAFAAGLEGL